MRDQLDLARPRLAREQVPARVVAHDRQAHARRRTHELRHELAHVGLQPTHPGLQEDRVDPRAPRDHSITSSSARRFMAGKRNAKYFSYTSGWRFASHSMP